MHPARISIFFSGPGLLMTGGKRGRAGREPGVLARRSHPEGDARRGRGPFGVCPAGQCPERHRPTGISDSSQWVACLAAGGVAAAANPRCVQSYVVTNGKITVARDTRHRRSEGRPGSGPRDVSVRVLHRAVVPGPAPRHPAARGRLRVPGPGSRSHGNAAHGQWCAAFCFSRGRLVAPPNRFD